MSQSILSIISDATGRSETDFISPDSLENSNEAFRGYSPSFSPTTEHNNEEQTQNTDLESLNEDSNNPQTKVEAEKRHSTEKNGSPPAKMRRLSGCEDDVDGETCPICLESWANSGDHRLVALKCGHLFGARCVERWLKTQPVKDRVCPTCKTKASLKDLRCIYARRLVAVDTSDITELQKQLTTIQAEKNRCELELRKSHIAHRACLQLVENMKQSLLKNPQQNHRTVKRNWRLALEKNIELCKDGGCRVLAYNCRTYDLYVSQKSTNNLFPGYGIRKVSCIDYKPGQFVHLHPKAIRDLSYSQPKDMLLSVALDKTARLVVRSVPEVRIQAEMPLWSCAWDFYRSDEFYVGGVGGKVLQYDLRNTSNAIQSFNAPGDISPVVSLCSTQHGLLACRLNSCHLWTPSSTGEWISQAVPVEGPYTSMCYDHESNRAVISSRPNATCRSSLSLVKMYDDSGVVNCRLEQTFNSSLRISLMSRAAWVKVPGATWIAAHSESDATLYLHGVDGASTMSLEASDPLLDVTSIELNNNIILASLSETRLRMYKVNGK